MKIEKILEEIGLDFMVIDEENNMKIIKIKKNANICNFTKRQQVYFWKRNICLQMSNICDKKYKI